MCISKELKQTKGNMYVPSDDATNQNMHSAKYLNHHSSVTSHICHLLYSWCLVLGAVAFYYNNFFLFFLSFAFGGRALLFIAASFIVLFSLYYYYFLHFVYYIAFRFHSVYIVYKAAFLIFNL